MIKVKVGTKEDIYIYIYVFSRYRGSPFFLDLSATRREISDQKAFRLWGKGGGIQVPVFENTVIRLGSDITEGSFLYVPEAGTHLLRRDLIIQLGMGLGIEKGPVKVLVTYLTEEEEKKIDPRV